MWKEIDSFEKACEVKGIPTDLPIYPEFLTPLEKEKCIAEYKLGIIRDAIVGKSLDYSDQKSKKWFPILRFVPGFGWQFCYSSYYYMSSAGGQPLVFGTEEQSDYFGQQFINLLPILKK